MSPRTPTLPASDRRRSLHLVPPAPTDAENWKKLMNFLFVHEQDQLFVWLRSVRAAVDSAEKKTNEPEEAA